MRILLLFLTMLPTLVLASETIGRRDFTRAARLSRPPQILVEAQLSTSGIEKFQKLNRTHIGQRIRIEVAGIQSDFILRSPISGHSLEMGPYSEAEAERVISAINAP